MTIRIAVCQVQDVGDEIASFARQLGVTGVNITTAKIPAEDGYWRTDDLVDLRRRCEDRGLRLEVLENLPYTAYDHIILGLPGRDAQIENYCRTVRNLASAEIPILGFHFMPNGVWRTRMDAPARGGARATAYDHSQVHLGNKMAYAADIVPATEGAAGITADEIWENYEYFLDAVLPVADEVELLLAQHPDDPPVDEINGYARVFTSPEAYRRAFALSKGSPAWGVNLCAGTVSEMVGGADAVRDMIDTFGPLGRIRYVHFRDVSGTVPSFVEGFLGEGNYSPPEVIAHLARVGFDGWLQDDHLPAMDGDTGYGHRARANAIGYMQGTIAALKWAGVLDAD